MAINKNFVVKHGLEVKTNLLYADAQLDRVGIGTTLAYHKLHVNGNAKIQSDLQVVGVTSLGTNTSIKNGTLEAGYSGIGTYGQFLIATGAGIAWTTAPSFRKQEIFTALGGQQQFNFAHTLGFLDVFVNGVKLSTSEYTETSAFVTLLNGATVGDVVELIGYYLYDNIGAANTTGIQGITILEENAITGTPSQVTSINFVGANVTASGTGVGVTVRFVGAGVGIGSSGTQIGYGFTNLNFIGAGNTFKVNGQSIDISINSGAENFWMRNTAYSSGIVTTGNVGIGSTLPKSGHTLDVGGVINANSYFSNSNTLDTTVTTNANHNCFAAGPYAVETGRTLTVGNDSTFSVIGGSGGSVGVGGGSGFFVENTVGIHTTRNVGIGTTNPIGASDPNNTFVLNVGIVTANFYYGDGRYLQNVGVAVTDAAPANPVQGNLWWNEILGRGFVYYDSADAWVDFSPSGGAGGTINVIGSGSGGDGFFSNNQTNSGVHTTSLNVGIGTTNPRFQLEVGYVGAAGTSLWVNGNARVTGILTVGTDSIILDGNKNEIKIGTGVTIDASGTRIGIITANNAVYVGSAVTLTSGGIVAGLATVNQLNVTHLNATGIVTISQTIVGSAVTLTSGGIVAGLATVNQLNVTNLNVTGIITANRALIGSGVTINAGGISIVGVVTASTFIGTFPSGSLVGALPALDGSLLTGVVAAGTGVIVKDDGNLVGTAGTIDFGANLSVSSISAGIVTITATGGGSSQFVTTNAGIHTLSSVGIGTTNPTSALTVTGNGNFTGVVTATTFIGVLTGTASTATNAQGLIGTPNIIVGVTTTSTLNVGTGGTVITTTSTGSVGIGTTNPVNKLQVERFGIQTGFGTFAASAGITTFIDSFVISSTDFKIAEYVVHLQSSSSIQAQKVLIMQNGATAHSEEWAIMSQPDLLVSIGTTITSGSVRLNITPETGVSGIITYRFTRNTIL